ncbi:U3 snoRNP protein Utp14 [Schizosaccharomyces japonicus yFS275]|uniref:U3 snoRNP protein Utp14 n=1 Tax=Schizosaccharomyces japonicus (strain yFS275 / FY16936) TaxID=402676 RepID=B6K6T5_SCHJY|nr:U3 snoRNP protein Utp14 [Schizosaccharomyces japonicus yFS275]EEB09239.1 U3 snoRNP protein Utp14 [Schizosaccharomyces japonicus yFS275]
MGRRSGSKNGKKQRKTGKGTSKRTLESKVLNSYNEDSLAENDFMDANEESDNNLPYSTVVNSDEDEEIDSDEAFDEEDEERFSEWTFRASKSGQKAQTSKTSRTSEKPNEISLNEDDESEGSDEDEGMVDLDTLLGKDSGEDSDSQEEISESEATEDSEDENDSEDSSEDETSEESDFQGFNSESEDEDNEQKLESLHNYIASIDNKRKHVGDDEPSSSDEAIDPVKRTKVDFNEEKKESEFNVYTEDSRPKLQLSTLLSSLNSSQDIKSSLKPLISESSKYSERKLDAPLAKPIVERLERQAAYEQTKENLDKWKPIVAENRKADQLVFPMNDTVRPTQTNNELVATYRPVTDSEKAINSALASAGVASEEQIKKSEELVMNKLSVEEVAERTKQLRFMRELMFREERKAKRVAKIKSKTYHRIHKKERERLAQLVPKSEEELEQERIKEEFERAKERVTQKHRNTSKWAKKMLDRAGHGEEGSREAVLEHIQRRDELTRRIQGEDLDDDSDRNLESDEIDSDEDLDEQVSGAFNRIRSEQEPKLKGVMAMKFMRDAATAKAKQLDKDMEDFENQVAGRTDENDEDSVDENLVTDSNGRKSFAPQVTAAHNLKRKENVFLPKGSQQSEVAKALVEEAVASKKNSQNKKDTALAESDNPWLSLDTDKSSKRSASLSKDSNSQQKQERKLANRKARSASAQGDVDVVVDVNQGFGSNSDDEANLSDTIPTLTATSSKFSIQQRDLVAKAFAGDNVVAEFRRDKKAAVKEDAPKEEDNSLPGWGSWTGAGTKNKRKPKVKKVAGLDPSKRKDAKLKNVIINEKRNKHNAKLTVSHVPFPFESREQYERSLQVPMGPEWTTRATHHKVVAPHVVTKKGKVIQPLKAPSS